MDDLLEKCIAIAEQAGDIIMQVYESDDFGIKTKSDNSLLTRADKAANDFIESELSKMSPYPVLSEEGSHTVGDTKSFWLVDPIDGTREFVNKNGEFTVNIGLVKDNEPVLGVIYAPAFSLLYFGAKGRGAFKVEKGKKHTITSKYLSKIPTVAISRSHANEDTQAFLDELGKYKLIRTGSSLKLCYIAEGRASVYPRLGKTHLWDNCAGDAIVRAAGGSVRTLDGKLLKYHPKNIISPFFIAKTKD